MHMVKISSSDERCETKLFSLFYHLHYYFLFKPTSQKSQLPTVFSVLTLQNIFVVHSDI